jgi:hypothetical protein
MPSTESPPSKEELEELEINRRRYLVHADITALIRLPPTMDDQDDYVQATTAITAVKP